MRECVEETAVLLSKNMAMPTTYQGLSWPFIILSFWCVSTSSARFYSASSGQ